jgi:hypothetical protein
VDPLLPSTSPLAAVLDAVGASLEDGNIPDQFEGSHYDLNAVDQIKQGIAAFEADGGLLITTEESTEELEDKVRKTSEEIGKTIDVLAGADVAKFVLTHADAGPCQIATLAGIVVSFARAGEANDMSRFRVSQVSLKTECVVKFGHAGYSAGPSSVHGRDAPKIADLCHKRGLLLGLSPGIRRREHAHRSAQGWVQLRRCDFGLLPLSGLPTVGRTSRRRVRDLDGS